MKRTSRQTNALTWVLAAICGVAALGLDRVLITGPFVTAAVGGAVASLPGLVALAAAFAVSEALAAHIHFGGSAHTFSVTEAILVIGLIHGSPREVLISISLGTFATLAFFRRQSAMKIAFNLANVGLTSQVAALVFRLVPHGRSSDPRTWVAAFAAAAAFVIGGALLVSTVIGVHSGRFEKKSVSDGLKIGLGAGVFTVSTGVVAAILLDEAPRATPLMILPLVGVSVANAVAAQARKRADEVAFLHDASRRLLLHPEARRFDAPATDANETRDRDAHQLVPAPGSKCLDLAIQQLLERAATDLQLQHLELELDTNDGRCAVVLAAGAPLRHRCEPEIAASLINVAPSAATLRERGKVRDDELGRAILGRHLVGAITAPVVVEGSVVGVLLLGDQAASVFSLGPDDMQVAQALASHVSLLLESRQRERSLNEMRELERKLLSELQHDLMTGLLNRPAFTSRARELLSGGDRTAAMLLIDLDDFKRINDTFGHSGGDDLIVAVGQRLASMLRPGDLAARLGGDEFAVLLTRARDHNEYEAIATRISLELAKPLQIAATTVVPSASIGVALMRRGDGVETLSERADTAMYRSKTNGKGRVTVIDPDVDDYHRRPSTLAADIEHLNSDALRVVFQPVVRLTDHIIESHECLVRWRHPTLGLLRPDSFLRLIKSQELARTIDEFVVTSAIEATEALPLDGHPAGVSINLSPAQLGDRRMLTLLDSLITDRPDAIRCLRVEVSLRNLSRSVDAAKELLSEIRAYGIGLIVDDVELDSVPYGLIEAVHPVQLKLARTSVARLTEPAVAEVAAGIARFGQAIGCRVVAKGIETPALERAARNVGCECGQGYLYSRPRPLAVTRHLVVGSDS